MPKTHILDSDALIKKIESLTEIDHPFVVSLYETFEDDRYVYIITEYLENWSLKSYIKGNGPLDESFARKIFVQIIIAIEFFINRMNTDKCGLILEDIYLDKQNNIRMANYGFGEQDRKNIHKELEAEKFMNQISELYDDIWALGIILISMVTDNSLLRGSNTQQLNKIIALDPSIALNNKKLSPDLQDLIAKCITTNPSGRITIEDIRNHPWITNSYENKILVYIEESIDRFKFINCGHLDTMIIKQMIHMQIRTSDIADDIMNGVKTERTIFYKIMKRQNMINDLSIFTKPLSGGVIYSACEFDEKKPLRRRSSVDSSAFPSFQFISRGTSSSSKITEQLIRPIKFTPQRKTVHLISPKNWKFSPK